MLKLIYDFHSIYKNMYLILVISNNLYFYIFDCCAFIPGETCDHYTLTDTYVYLTLLDNMKIPTINV